MTSARILIIYTGGTIGMIENPETGSLKPFDFSHLSNEIPELNKFNYTLTSYAFETPLDSSNMTPERWIELAEIIGSNYTDYDGFVILHGSDTMSYTASALSFLLENLAKPVILTGSQLPIGTLRTDGKENLITAIEIAAAQKDGMATVPEVAIYFEYNLYRGNRTRKVDSEDFEAFQSLNYPHLASAGVRIKYNHNAISEPGTEDLIVHKSLDSNIAILRIFPGMKRELLKAILATEGIKALILETYGSGNAPNFDWFIEELSTAIDRGLIILNVTQCYGGEVIQGKYETSLKLQAIGVVGGGDMTTESALTKLMFLLGKGISDEEIKGQLSEDLRGEISTVKL